MLLTDADLLKASESFLWLRHEQTILRIADSANVVGRQRRVPGMTVPHNRQFHFTRLSTQSSNLGGLRFQRCMKAEKDFLVVLFELLYGD